MACGHEGQDKLITKSFISTILSFVQQCYLYDKYKVIINDKEYIFGKNGLYFKDCTTTTTTIVFNTLLLSVILVNP